MDPPVSSRNPDASIVGFRSLTPATSVRRSTIGRTEMTDVLKPLGGRTWVFYKPEPQVPSLHIFRRMTTLLSPNGATILKPCFLNMETVPRYSRYAPHRTIGYASTRPPPFFLMASRAPFNATLATPCLRCVRSTTKQVILQSLLTSPSRASLR